MGLSYGPPTSVRGVTALLVVALIGIAAFYLSGPALLVFGVLAIIVAVVLYALGLRGFSYLVGW